jgi:shikimate 5-dehydrogenase
LEDLNPFDHVRLSSRIAPHVLKSLRVQSSWITLLGVFDGMVKTHQGWWPLCALYEAFGQILIQLGSDLDTRGNVFIAGAGGAARTAMIAFFKAGFTNFLVTNFDPEEAEKMMADVRAKFFGLKTQWVPMEGIVLLPGETAVLINCTPSVEENPLLVELSYLNFLKRPGYLIELSRSKKPSVLVQEAQDVGVRVTGGVDVAARADVLWAEWAFKTKLDFSKYHRELGSTLA